MFKQLLLNYIGMTEDQIIQESSEIVLNTKEAEVFNKCNDFIDEYKKLKNQDLKRIVILKIIAYQLDKRNRGK